MLKIVALLQKKFVETMINVIFHDSLMNRKFKRTVLLETEILGDIINMFTVTCDQLNQCSLAK